MPQSDDQRAIRALAAEWIAATKRGDGQAVLDPMTDDVVFLVSPISRRFTSRGTWHISGDGRWLLARDANLLVSV